MSQPPIQSAALATALDAALEQAEKSWREGGIPIGSTLVNQRGTILAVGHNRRVQRGSVVLHAEMDCLENAGRRRDWSLCTLVSTLSPCPMCSGAVLLYRIPRVVIGENRTYLGAEDWLRSQGVDLQIVDDPRCVAWMERLQQERPDLWAEDIGDSPCHCDRGS
ncbi:nucleoside deaminase [Synechococcus elongatus IITB7]|uniref:nucleoside deaminase n=1 Tax=Synechococcus elongatus TaxID=32046 RepID=UPI0030D33D69